MDCISRATELMIMLNFWRVKEQRGGGGDSRYAALYIYRGLRLLLSSSQAYQSQARFALFV